MECKFRLSIVLACVFWWRVVALDTGCLDRSIKPCECSEEKKNDEIVQTISCSGSIPLPTLTSILREKLCAQHIYRFRLEQSNIGYLPSNLFYKIKVDKIDITDTNITHFTRGGNSAFHGLEKVLKSLSMRKCALVDSLDWQMIGRLDALNTLDLSENELTSVPEQWFENPPMNLQFLYLRANDIESISPSAFASMFHLHYLDLSDNRISTLSRSSFPYPGNSIGFLILSNNELRSLPEDFFHEMYGLRRLYLDNNYFETLDEKTWTPIWGELDVLELLDNYLKCGCDMQWITKLYPIKHLHGTCHKISLLANRKLKSLWPWDFNCSSTTTET